MEVRIDVEWRNSLLAAIARCDTLDALQFVWRRWAADVATCEWKAELVEAKDARKMQLDCTAPNANRSGKGRP